LAGAAAYGLFVIYRHYFIEGYFKRIRKTIDDNDMKKAEEMKATALKRQPKTAPAFFVKYKIEKEKDNLQSYEIEFNGVEDGSLATVELQLTTGDLFHADFWYLLNRSSVLFRVLWLLMFIWLFINMIDNFSAYYLSIAILFIGLLIFNRIKVYNYYKKYPKNTVKILFYSGKMILMKKGKVYSLSINDIEKVYNTRKYLYAIIKNKTVFIIPKRFIPKKELSIILDSINVSQSAAKHTV
jgi:hypothetical protein